MSTNTWRAAEIAQEQLEKLRREYVENAQRDSIHIEELKTEITKEIGLIQDRLLQSNDHSFISRFKIFKRGTDQNIKDLQTALEILNKPSRDTSDIDRLSAITQGIDKKFEGNTSVLVSKVEKIVKADSLIKNKHSSTIPMSKEKLLLHAQIRGQRDACFAQKDSKYHDKYLVLTVALAVLDGKATLKDLAKAKQDYPKYNESRFMHRTTALIEKAILLCEPPAKTYQKKR